MHILTPQEILTAAIGAGWTGSMAQVAAAIVLAESKGDRFCVGDKDLAPLDGPAIGLWQINIGKHLDAAAMGFALFLPEVNAEWAYKIYSAANFSFKPWSTFIHGQYLSYLPQIQQVQAQNG